MQMRRAPILLLPSIARLLAGKVRKIMCVGSKIIKERQKAIRREMDRRQITLTVVSLDSGIKLGTLATYFPADGLKEPVQIPQGAVYDLKRTRALPIDLLNLLQPDGMALVELPTEVDVHEVGLIVAEIVRLKNAAHLPDSPAGVEISECERDAIVAEVVKLRAVAS